MQKIDLNTATVTCKNSIIYVIFKEVPEVPATEILAIIKACQEFSKGKPFCVLTDMRNFIEVTPEGRELAADRSRNPNLIANAVLVKKLGARLHAGVFQEVNRPQHSIEIFNEENEALEWLRAEQKRAEKSKIPFNNK